MGERKLEGGAFRQVENDMTQERTYKQPSAVQNSTVGMSFPPALPIVRYEYDDETAFANNVPTIY